MEEYRRSFGVCPIVSSELGTDESFNIFEEDSIRLGFFDEFKAGRKEVSRVFVCVPRSCCAKWLAWESSSEEIHFSKKIGAWEGFSICPNRVRR